MKKLLALIVLFIFSISFSQELKTTTIDAYNGTRLESVTTTLNGFHVSKSTNDNIGFSAINTNNTGNAAQANLFVKGAGALYTNYTGLSHYNNGYYVSWLRNSGLLFSDSKLFVGTWNNKDIEFRSGSTFSSMSPLLTIQSTGAIKIHIAPSSEEGTILGVNGSGTIIGVNNAVKINQNSAPSSATDTGTKGEIRVPGDGYIYYCIASNLWVKAQLLSF